MLPPRPQILSRGGRTYPARCTIGLLTWNAGHDGLAAVGSIMAQTEPTLELIWIDNASTDGTVPRLRGRFPRLAPPCINPRNLGFCRGHNQALAVCRTPYYLALNQDAELENDYVTRLCDWLDENPHIAMASGLILLPDKERIYSAGMAWPRSRFAFELKMDRPVRDEDRERRLVPAVDGAAMLLRVEACRRVSMPPREIFPKTFFAYGEEVDLALRLARAGLLCGVDGTTVATHRARGSGGFAKAAIRARFFLNHWLLTLRHDDWGTILRDLPWIAHGELKFWLREYWDHPWAFWLALLMLPMKVSEARRFYHVFEREFGPSRQRMDAVLAFSRRLLRESQPPSEEPAPSNAPDTPETRRNEG